MPKPVLIQVSFKYQIFKVTKPYSSEQLRILSFRKQIRDILILPPTCIHITFRFQIGISSGEACMTPVLHAEMRLQCRVAENPLVQKAKESRGCSLGGPIMKWTFSLKIPFRRKLFERRTPRWLLPPQSRKPCVEAVVAASEYVPRSPYGIASLYLKVIDRKRVGFEVLHIQQPIQDFFYTFNIKVA